MKFNYIKIIKPVNFTDYVNLQINSKIVISDSGTINEEASILNLNAINFRNTHERPESNEEASTILSGISEDNFFKAVDYYDKTDFKHTIVRDYDVDNVSDKIVKILIGYGKYINTYKYFK